MAVFLALDGCVPLDAFGAVVRWCVDSVRWCADSVRWCVDSVRWCVGGVPLDGEEPVWSYWVLGATWDLF